MHCIQTNSHFRTIGVLGALALSLGGTAFAQDAEDEWSDSSSSTISDSETSFNGAVMLQGGIDVRIGDVGPGLYDDDQNDQYAFFSGNTLYAGTEDEIGNTIDMIVEFFWFESSIDRGSDFYVAVVKARTSPIVADGWRLRVDDEPVLSLLADTSNPDENAGFRWDWSLPFESYGWDSYGDITMETSYGIGLNAEGAAMQASGTEEDGTSFSSNVQAKGYFNTDYRVQSRYQITLWRWEMLVHGTPDSMEWDLYLDTRDRSDENAYHEYFLVMQTDEEKPFTIDNLDLSGTVYDPIWYWWDTESNLSVLLEDITLTRPEWEAEDYTDEDYEEDDGSDDDDIGEDDGTIEVSTQEDTENDASDSDENGLFNFEYNEASESKGCNVASPASSTSPYRFMLAALALGMTLLGRRRR